MTNHAETHQESPSKTTSRRRLITGAAAAAAATAATVAHPDSAAAADGDPLLIGELNTSATTTLLECVGKDHDQHGLAVRKSQGGTAIHAEADDASWACIRAFGGDVGVQAHGAKTGVDGFSHGVGVRAESGGGDVAMYAVTTSDRSAVLARNDGNGAGVAGEGFGRATGVTGTSSEGHGVTGETGGRGYSGVRGRHGGVGSSTDGYGVRGECFGTGVGVAGFGYGYGDGVKGNSANGHGVSGETSNATKAGVRGINTGGGPGVHGTSAEAGIGVLAEGGTGPALKVTGRAVFNQSGVAVIPSGAATVSVFPAMPPTAGSLMIATIQENRPGRHVASAVPDATLASFVISLNEPVDVATKVGWFVVN